MGDDQRTAPEEVTEIPSSEITRNWIIPMGMNHARILNRPRLCHRPKNILHGGKDARPLRSEVAASYQSNREMTNTLIYRLR